MKSSMELGIHVQDRLDKISNFPDELLALILSFLPTVHAVRTSILSRRWRYLFTLTDCLSFDDAPCFTYPGKSKETFKKFVYKVLELHQMSAIRKFSLVCQGNYNKSHLNAWVEHAIQKGVRELNYQAGEYELPNALVTCKTIVKLRVKGYGNNIEFPPSSRWPSLKIVHLNNVRFGDYHSIERFLSSCEFIEELSLDHCELRTMGGHLTIFIGLLKVLRINHCYVKNNGFFEIKAPNLAYLTYDSNIGVKIVPLWKNSCSLVKAELCFNSESNDHSLTDERDILRAAAYKTTTLRLLSASVQCLLMMDDVGQMPDFHSLSKLHLDCHIRYDSWKYVTNLLDKSPQLETVIFEEGLLYCSLRPMSPPCESLLPFSCHAQVIEVHKFCVHEGSLLLLRHLVRNARFLKNLIIHRCRCSNDVKKVLQINDLMNLPRALSKCVLN